MIRLSSLLTIATLSFLTLAGCSNKPEQSTAPASPSASPAASSEASPTASPTASSAANPLTAPADALKQATGTIAATKQKVTGAVETAKTKVAEVTAVKEGFEGMVSVVANTKAAVDKGDFAAAKTEFAAFEGHWSKVEDGVKTKSADTYKAIEDSMDNVSIALKSGDKAKALTALQTLGKDLAGYVSKS